MSVRGWACRSLRKLLEYSGPGSVEETFCQVFAIEESVGGAQYTVELLPGGVNVPVTEENRRDFVDKYVEYVLSKSVERQYNAFLEGLMMLCKGPAITLFSPVEMERLVCGNPHLDFTALKNASKYEGGFTAATEAVVWLWDIACNEFGLPEQRMFLKFFTGARPTCHAPASACARVLACGPDCWCCTATHARKHGAHCASSALLLPDIQPHQYHAYSRVQHLTRSALSPLRHGQCNTRARATQARTARRSGALAT